MTTSFTRTREQLREMIGGKLGITGATSVSSADSDVIIEAIDIRLKEMHRLGIFWRDVTKVPWTTTVTANTPTASGTADILFPIAVTVTVNSVDEPVEIISVRQYAQIDNKTYAGDPTKVLFDGSNLIFWPVPSTNRTANITYERIATDSTAGSAIDVDVSMLRWIRDIIAYDLGDNFGKSEAMMARWAGDAERAERKIRALAVERVDATDVAVDDFQPNPSNFHDYTR